MEDFCWKRQNISIQQVLRLREPHTGGAVIFSQVTMVCPFCCFYHLINTTFTSFKEIQQIQSYGIIHPSVAEVRPFLWHCVINSLYWKDAQLHTMNNLSIYCWFSEKGSSAKCTHRTAVCNMACEASGNIQYVIYYYYYVLVKAKMLIK